MKNLWLFFGCLLLGISSFCFADSLDQVVLPKYEFNFYSADLNDPFYIWHPWRARIINTEKMATTWYFDSHSKPAIIDILKYKTKTYKPYPGQVDDQSSTIGGHTATVKVYLTEPSVCQSLLWNPNGGYYGYFQGAGLTTFESWPYPHYSYSALNVCNESQRLASEDDNFADYGYRLFKQTDYPGIHYGDSGSKATIPQLGCYLCSMCGAARSKGVQAHPIDAQNWLASQPDGYSNHTLVNPLAFMRYINSTPTNGKIFVFRRNVPVNEALDRNMAVQVSVKNGGHWVNAIAHKVRNEDSTLKTEMRDPMFDKIGFTTLEDYSGVASNNTRCWYWKNTWIRALLISEADWGLSGVVASTMDEVNLDLVNSSGQTIESAAAQWLEKDDVSSSSNAEDESLVYAGRMLLAENIPSDNYKVNVSGMPGTGYSVKVFNYKENGYPLMTDQWGYPIYVKTYAGTLGESGIATIPIPHILGTVMGVAVSPEGLSDGTGITYDLASDIPTVVTGIIPNVGFYVQSLTAKVKPLLVKTAYPALVGEQVLTIRGKVATLNSQRCISVGDYDLVVKNMPTVVDLPEPVGVSPEKATTTWHFYTRTFGRITEKSADSLVLNGHLKVWCPPNEMSVGDFITAEGVEHANEFFVGIGASLKKVE